MPWAGLGAPAGRAHRTDEVTADGGVGRVLRQLPYPVGLGVAATKGWLMPSLLGLVVVDDGVLPGQAPLAVVGFALALAGTVCLVRFAE